MNRYTVQRGETKRWLLWDEPGADLTGVSVEAVLRPFDRRRGGVQPGDAVAAALTPAPFAGEGERGPGFYLTLAAADSEALDLGLYQADARVTLAGNEIAISEAWHIEVVEPATRPQP